MDLRLDDSVSDRILETAQAGHGGRGIGNAVEQTLINPLSRFLFEHEHQLRRGRTIAVLPSGDGVAFEIEEGTR